MSKLTENKANDKARLSFTEALMTVFSASEQNVLRVASNKLAIPFVNELGSQKWYVVTITVPKGTRDGDPYDGVAEAEDYAFRLAEKEKAKEKVKTKAKK